MANTKTEIVDTAQYAVSEPYIVSPSLIKHVPTTISVGMSNCVVDNYSQVSYQVGQPEPAYRTIEVSWSVKLHVSEEQYQILNSHPNGIAVLKDIMRPHDIGIHCINFYNNKAKKVSISLIEKPTETYPVHVVQQNNHWLRS